jgi:hypothetical protein
VAGPADMPIEDLMRTVGVPPSGVNENAVQGNIAVLSARVTLLASEAQEASAEALIAATNRLSRQTKLLVWATVAVAAMTLASVIAIIAASAN